MEKRNKVLFISLVLLWRKDVVMLTGWNFILVLKHRKIPDFNLVLTDLFCFSIFFLLFPLPPSSSPSSSSSSFSFFFFFGTLPSHLWTFCQNTFVSK